MARVSAAPAVRYVSHPKRPEWGVGRVIEDQNELVRVAFADGVVRSFRGDVLVAAPPPEGAAPIEPASASPPPEKARRAAPKRARKPA